MAQSVGLLEFLRRNRSFRRLWYSQVASQLGDWFVFIALATLLLQLTQSATAIGLLTAIQFLPGALAGLGVGVLIDRLPRRQVMIAADLGRALLVLLFLLVRDADQVWIIYLVLFLKESLTACYEPAREAFVPSVAARADLVAANLISGLTWSVMLTGGAALGGVVTSTLGTDAAFLLDAASFLISAFFLFTITDREQPQARAASSSFWQDLRAGYDYLMQHREIALYALSKTLWSIAGGGILVLLSLFGKNVFPLGAEGGLSIGLLYAARGLGAGLGPILAQRWGGQSVGFLRRALGPAFLLMATGYFFFSVAPSLPLAALAVLVAHLGGSTQWVFSTALLQLSVPARLQGRIFAIEWTLLTLATALSSLATGLAADAGWPPQVLARILAALFIPSGLLLLVLRRDPAGQPRTTILLPAETKQANEV